MAKCKSCNGNSTTSPCVVCDVNQMARNHYFTGKLLVERDFTEEHLYHMGKARRHNKYLHGMGVPCGLQVTEHPSPECRHQYVMVAPGVAIDCCGREIFLDHEEHIYFRDMFLAIWRDQNGQEAEPDDQPRDIELCVQYYECLTEEIPAIFDDCGCDDTAVQANRILENYQFSLRILPDPDAEMAAAWTEKADSISEGYRRLVADIDTVEARIQQIQDDLNDDPGNTDLQEQLDAASAERVQLLGYLSRVETKAQTLRDVVSDVPAPDAGYTSDEFATFLKSLILGAYELLKVRENRVQRLHAAHRETRDEQIQEALEIALIERDNLLTLVYELEKEVAEAIGEPLPDDPHAEWELALDSSGHLINDHCPDCPEECVVLAVIRDYVYDKPILSPESLISLDESDLTLDTDTAYIDNGVRHLLPNTSDLFHFIQCIYDYLQNVDYEGLDDVNLTMVACDQPPVAEIVAVGDQRVLNLEIPKCEGGEQPIDDVRLKLVGCDEPGIAELIEVDGKLLLNLQIPTGCDSIISDVDVTLLPCGDTPTAEIVENTDGTRTLSLKLPDCPPGSGGDNGIDDVQLALVDCDEPHFVKIKDNADGTRTLVMQLPDCNETTLNGISKVQLKLVDCDSPHFANIIDHADGTRTLVLQLPECNDGTDGPINGIDNVQLSLVDCDSPHFANVVDNADGTRTLVLQLPECNDTSLNGIDDVELTLVDCNSPHFAQITVQGDGSRKLVLQLPECNDGSSIVAPPLTQVCAINWDHADQGLPVLADDALDILSTGFLVGFNGEVRAGDIHEQTFQVLLDTNQGDTLFACWCELRPEFVGGVRLDLNPQGDDVCFINSIVDPSPSPNTFVNGAQFKLNPGTGLQQGSIIRVVLKGDLITGLRDGQEHSVDGNHLHPWLPKGPSGDSTVGGTFESWFTFGGDPGDVVEAMSFTGEPAFIEATSTTEQTNLINVNTATKEELTQVPGFGPEIAEAIVMMREKEGNFETIDSLISVPGIGEVKLASIRDQLTV